MLTGKHKSPDDFGEGDGRRFFLRLSAGNLGRNLVLVDGLERAVRRKGCSVGQLCLAWLLAQDEDVFPIP
jgi:aryl-alcohol dehydrogenase-like predicted oxidoreductase